MTLFLFRLLVSALIIAAATEAARRSTVLGALIASLPLTSILVMSWVYFESGDAARVAALSRGIFWAVLPSLVLFVALPVLIRLGVRFVPAMLLSCAVTAASYAGYLRLAARLGLPL